MFLCRLSRSFVAEFDVTLPLSVKKTIPESEERLREVRLDTPALMVNVVIGRIVVSKVLQRIPGESIAAMIVHSLDSGTCEEPHGLTVRHARYQKPNASTSSIKKEAFHRVIIEGAEGVWDIKPMMARVESDCKLLVGDPRVTKAS